MNQNKLGKFISKLNRLTQQDSIKWNPVRPPGMLTEATNDTVHYFYSTEYKGQKIGIYPRKFQVYNQDLDDYHWDQAIVVVLLDDDNFITWEESSDNYTFFDLYNAVRSQASNADEIIDRLLSEDDEDEDIFS